MNLNNKEIAQEIIRQGELRIKGILDFSNELDSKIYKLLAILVTVMSGLVLFHIKEVAKSNLNQPFTTTLEFTVSLFIIATLFLLRTISPSKYRGIGLPLDEIATCENLSEIAEKTKNRYQARFKHNKQLNNKKSDWLRRAIILLSLSPATILGFHIINLLELFCSPVIIIVIIAVIHIFIFKIHDYILSKN